MAVAVNVKGSIGLGIESSFGAGGSITDYQPIISEDITLNANHSYENYVQNSPEQSGGQFASRSLNGNIVIPVSPNGTTLWWQAGLGQSSSPYSAERPLDSLTIAIDQDAGAIITSGDRIGSLEFNSAAGNILQCTIGLEGKGYTSTTTLTPTYTSGDQGFLHSEGVFKLDDVETLDITSFAVTCNNNLITDLYANQQERRDIPATKLTVTGNFTKLFQDTNTRAKFLQRLPVKVEAIFTRGGKSFTITLAKVKINSRPTPLAGQTNYISETFNFTSYVDDASTEKSIVLTVV